MGFQAASSRIQQGARLAMVAVSAYAGISVKAFASFEDQMANVSTMLDLQTMKYMPGYGRAVKRMAIDFGEGSATLSTGLYNILSASIKAEDGVGTLESAVRAAKAGITDTATATYAITGILNAYGLSADKAGRVSDILFSTVKKGQTTFGQLAPVVGRVTAISSGAGIALEEVSAALSTITRGGISTDEAITGLRQAIIALQGQQDQAIKIAKQHGIELSNDALAAEGLTGMLKKLSGLSESVISDIFKEVRARVSLSVLLKDQAGYVNDYQAALHSAGRTQEAYGKMTDTLGHTFRQLGQAMKIGMVDLIEPFSGQLKTLTGLILEQTAAWRNYWEAATGGGERSQVNKGWRNLGFAFTSGFMRGGMSDPATRAQWELAEKQYEREQGKWQQVGPGGMFRVPSDTERFETLFQHFQSGALTNLPEGKLKISPEMEKKLLAMTQMQGAQTPLKGKVGNIIDMEGAEVALGGDSDLAHKRADITARMYEDMRKLGTGYYEAQKGLVDLEMTDYSEFIEDKVLLNEWYVSKVQLLAVESSGFWLETRNALQGTQSALSDFMMDFASLEGLIDSIGQSFQRMFANLASQLAMSGIMNLLVGGPMAGALGFQNPLAGAGNAQMGGLLGEILGSAFGNVFRNGRLVPMAGGAVLNSPTYFPMAGGKIGMAGEAGPELGFVPLRRHGGRLGLDTPAQPPITVNPTPVKIVIVADRKAAALEAMRSSEGQAQIIGTLREHGII